MKKLLTISIAAYNVAPYLRQTLDSCLIPELEDLDIIVVNDGSTDTTSQIAHEYASKYPRSVRVIDKENGGYGTTINASLAVASGRFYKLLDGDDWFDRDALSGLVRILRDCANDVVVTPYCECVEDGEKTVVDQAAQAVTGDQPLTANTAPRRLSMHSLTYRTQLLREADLQLPARRLYTDTLYATIPLVRARTCTVSHAAVYQYRVGRDGQSMSLSSLVSHHEELAILVRELAQLVGQTEPESYARVACMDWLTIDAVMLMRVLYSMPPSADVWACVCDLRQQVSSVEGLWARCDEKSRVWWVQSRTPARAYTLVAHAWSLRNGLSKGRL